MLERLLIGSTIGLLAVAANALERAGYAGPLLTIGLGSVALVCIQFALIWWRARKR